MREKKAIALLATVAVAGALGIAGCGDGDSATGETAPAKAPAGGDAMKQKGHDAMKGEDHGDAMKEG